MLLFGHIGITLGAATVIAGGINHREGKTSWIVSLSKYADIRLLMVGALLPDIIDKPLGHYFLRNTLNNGRIFSHTLLFLIVMAAIGFIIFKKKHQTWMLVIAAGILAHLILDGMWGLPGTLFWPLLGFSFHRGDVENYLQNLFSGMFTDPSAYIPETIGLVILIWFVITVIRGKQVGSLIKSGRIS